MQNRCLGTVAYMGGVFAMPAEFLWSWGQMIQYNTEAVCQPGEYVHYDRATVSIHPVARNQLAERMKGDWLLMLDTDHAFEPDLLARLLWQMRDKDIDVLSGLYQFRGAPHSPVLYRYADPAFLPIVRWDGDPSVMQIDGAGAGCLLVRRGVFDRIREELHEEPFAIRPGFYEDLSFFLRLRDLGISAYVAPRVECHHLAVTPTSMAGYDGAAIPATPYDCMGAF